MTHGSLLYCIVLSAVLSVSLERLEGAQQPKGGGSLTVEEVIKMSQSGFSEEVIITRVRKNGKVFDLNNEELLDIKKAGVSENVIKFLLDPLQPYTPPTPPPPPPSVPDPAPAGPPKPSAPAKNYPEDAFAPRVPADPGLYFFRDDAPVRIDIKMLLGVVEGAGVGKLLKLKGKTIAYLVGPAAKTRTGGTAPIFYLRLLEGKAIEEVVLIAFERKHNRREIDVGPPGPKQELKGGAMRQFDSLEVGARLFKITPVKLAKGEYIFFLMGSAEPPKGSQGKGYDFGIAEPVR
jgi:hypothetical protein